MTNKEQIECLNKRIKSYEERDDDDTHSIFGRPFRIVAKLRNNRLIKAREILGYFSTRIAADTIGIAYPTLLDFEAFRRSPWGKYGWKPIAIKIAEAYAYHPEELWPDVIAQVCETKAFIEVGSDSIALSNSSPEEIVGLCEVHNRIRQVLILLSPREEKVLLERCGLNDDGDGRTIVDIAEDLGVTTSRVRQIEQHALRTLRQQKMRKMFP